MSDGRFHSVPEIPIVRGTLALAFVCMNMTNVSVYSDDAGKRDLLAMVQRGKLSKAFALYCYHCPDDPVSPKYVKRSSREENSRLLGMSIDLKPSSMVRRSELNKILPNRCLL